MIKYNYTYTGNKVLLLDNIPICVLVKKYQDDTKYIIYMYIRKHKFFKTKYVCDYDNIVNEFNVSDIYLFEKMIEKYNGLNPNIDFSQLKRINKIDNIISNIKKI